MAAKSKILVIGGTGYIGKFIVQASAKAGHPTFVLVRECSLSNHAKSKIIHHLITLGAFIVFVRKLQHLSYIFTVITYVYSNIRPCFLWWRWWLLVISRTPYDCNPKIVLMLVLVGSTIKSFVNNEWIGFQIQSCPYKNKCPLY